MKRKKTPIDIHAGSTAKGTMIYTAAHEVTHFIREWSAKKFKVLADFLVDKYGDGHSVDALVEKQQEKAWRNRKERLSYGKAFEEFVADSMEKMLSDGKVGEMFLELRTKDKSLVEKILEGLKNFANRIKQMYKKFDPDSYEGKLVGNMKTEMAQFQKLLADALNDASETYQWIGGESVDSAQQKNTTEDGDVKYQTRSVNGNQVVWIEENILKENNGLPVHQFIADFIAEHIGEVYTIIESGQKVYIGEDLPNEYTQSKYTQKILRNNPNIVKVKNRASANLGEIIEIATNRRWEKTKHDTNKDAKYGMYRYDTRFGFPVLNSKKEVVGANIYTAELIIRNASNGKKYLYDIVGIKKDTVSSDWMSKKTTSAAVKSAGQKNNVSINSILNSNETVKENDVQLSDRDYSYEALISKPDMKVTTVGGDVPTNRADVVVLAKKNAAKVGKFNPKTGSVSVYVDDIGADVVLSTKGLRHGLRRTRSLQDDINSIVTLQAGKILKNSIRINELTPAKEEATNSYVLIGVAKSNSGDLYIVQSVVNHFSNELISMDVLYAINAKKEELAATKSPRFTARPLSVTSSTISISDLLDYVNEYFPDILPEDVLRHYGHDARPEGTIGESALFSDRDKENNVELSKRNFSYDELVTKDDLHGVVIDKTQYPKIVNGIIDNNWVIKKARENCEILNEKERAAYYTKVPDIRTNVEITAKSLTHGFARPNDRKNNQSSAKAITNARVSLAIPQILKNSIEVNRSQRGNNIDVPYTHVLIGTVALEDSNGVLEYYAVRSMVEERKNQEPVLVEADILGKLTSVNAKK